MNRSISRADRQRTAAAIELAVNFVFANLALGGDGQVTYGSAILKADTRKIRWILDKKMLVGFAGSTADAFALLQPA